MRNSALLVAAFFAGLCALHTVSLPAQSPGGEEPTLSGRRPFVAYKGKTFDIKGKSSVRIADFDTEEEAETFTYNKNLGEPDLRIIYTWKKREDSQTPQDEGISVTQPAISLPTVTPQRPITSSGGQSGLAPTESSPRVTGLTEQNGVIDTTILQDQLGTKRPIPENPELIMVDPRQVREDFAAARAYNVPADIPGTEPLLKMMIDHDKTIKASIVSNALSSKGITSPNSSNDILGVLRKRFEDKLKADKEREQREKQSLARTEQRREAATRRQEEERLRVQQAKESIESTRARSNQESGRRYPPGVLP